MKIQKKQLRILAILVLLTMVPVLAKKGGGSGPPGGGDEPCVSDLLPNDQLIEGAQPVIDGLDFDGFRLASLAAVETLDGVLIAVGGSSTPNVAEAVDRLVILRYDDSLPDGLRWSLVHDHTIIDIETAGLKPGVQFVDLDGNGDPDLLVGSRGTNSAAVIYDVDSNPELYKLVKPPEAEFFGSGMAFDGSCIYVGAATTNRGDGAVYFYDQTRNEFGELEPLGTLPIPDGGEGHFGYSVTVDDDNNLYVAAPYASRGTRDSGLIFCYSSPAWMDSNPLKLSRDLKGDELGRSLATANGTDLVALPGRSNGESAAVFPDGIEQAAYDLAFTPERRQGLSNLSTGDLMGSPLADDEVVFRQTPTGVLLYEDPSEISQPQPLVLNDPDCGSHGFGRGMAIAGGYFFVAEQNRDINLNGTGDGQIYVFTLSP